MSMPCPPLPIHRPQLISSGGAFISYVRRRGEPDGGRNDTEITTKAPTTQNTTSLYPNVDSSLANTTDSELSDGYTSQTLCKSIAPKLGYSSLRGPVRVSRPGGGGESDAAFTPSPPVTTQNVVDPNVSLALAHQTRIRNLYSSSGFLGDKVIPEMSIPPSMSRRPDSSSSASSTTDWEGSGHATVLRRSNPVQTLPPLPPPRQNLPLVDSLRPLAPLAPVYNNLGNASVAGPSNPNPMGNGIESTSSDSEFERGLEIPPPNLNNIRGKSKLKLNTHQLIKRTQDQLGFMDRLSVRTEVSNGNTSAVGAAGCHKPLNIPEDENALAFNSSNLYFSPSDTEIDSKKDIPAINTLPSTSAVSKDVIKTSSKNIQDSIMRQINREMTPTISEVYHERNLGLGLAPPLSKLLLSKNYDESEGKLSAAGCAIKSIVEAVSEIDLNVVTNSCTPNTSSTMKTVTSDTCPICNEPSDIICRCKAATAQKKSSAKPWLSNIPSNILKGSDLTTADILERQNKIKTNNSNETTNTLIFNNGKRSNSPFSELSRRDEGDGRSVADSQCSGSYKTDINNGNSTNNVQVQSIRTKFGTGT